MILENRINIIQRNPTIVKNNSHGFYMYVKYSRPTSGKKGQKLLHSLEKNHSSIINRTHSTHTEKIGGYRFLNNPRITEPMLVKSLQQQCKQNCEGLHVIGIQDTTEYNYQHHLNRLKENTLGLVGNNSDRGYFAHLMVTFDAATCLPQGISYCQLWSRDRHHKDRHERQYKKLPIEEKESIRWLEAAEQSKTLLKSAKHITILSDREGDIYQLWDRIPDKKTDFIIRARTDRALFDHPSTLNTLLEQQSIAGSYTIELKEDQRAKHSKRKALINIRYTELKIKKPRDLTMHHAEHDHVTLMAIDAKEDPQSCKAGEPPVHWVLLTTHAIHTFEHACRIIDWYGFRWQIEQFFRITKRQGIDLESSQLETGEGLKKLGLMGFASALRILQMSLSRDGIVNDNVQKYFDPVEVEVLGLLDVKLKGTTLKQQNPHRKNTLAWAAWIIARLGGNTGYASQSPPGPITFKWGLDKFSQIINGYNLLKKDVYKE
jgi:Transposase DDE domain